MGRLGAGGGDKRCDGVVEFLPDETYLFPFPCTASFSLHDTPARPAPAVARATRTCLLPGLSPAPLIPTQSTSAKDDGDDLDPETDALTDLHTQDSQADRAAARPSVSSTRGNR